MPILPTRYGVVFELRTTSQRGRVLLSTCATIQWWHPVEFVLVSFVFVAVVVVVVVVDVLDVLVIVVVVEVVVVAAGVVAGVVAREETVVVVVIVVEVPQSDVGVLSQQRMVWQQGKGGNAEKERWGVNVT